MLLTTKINKLREAMMWLVVQNERVFVEDTT